MQKIHPLMSNVWHQRKLELKVHYDSLWVILFTAWQECEKHKSRDVPVGFMWWFPYYSTSIQYVFSKKKKKVNVCAICVPLHPFSASYLGCGSDSLSRFLQISLSSVSSSSSVLGEHWCVPKKTERYVVFLMGHVQNISPGKLPTLLQRVVAAGAI